MKCVILVNKKKNIKKQIIYYKEISLFLILIKKDYSRNNYN